MARIMDFYINYFVMARIMGLPTAVGRCRVSVVTGQHQQPAAAASTLFVRHEMQWLV